MKSYIKRLSLVAAALTILVVASMPASLQADEWNLKTFITVNKPFQVPGKVLEPNTKYVLKRMDGNAGTNTVVQVFNADQSKLLAMFMAIPDYRLEPTDDTVLTFMETAPGYPKPIDTWFYPGRLNGLEFLYSKEQKQEIALHQGTGAAVVETAMNTTPEPAPMPAPATETVTPSDNNSEYSNEATVEKSTEEATIERTKPADTTVAEPEPAPAPEAPAMSENQNNEASQNTLPRTAGEMPLFGLVGFACFGLRYLLRMV